MSGDFRGQIVGTHPLVQHSRLRLACTHAIFMHMSKNTTRPVAVNAETWNARRHSGDDGVPANGTKQPLLTHDPEDGR